MNCRKRAKSMIEQLIKEINICLENECFLCTWNGTYTS